MISIPLDIISMHTDGFHPLVEVVVFGTCYKAVLDTGASRSVLDKQTVEKHVKDDKLLLSDRLSAGLGTTTMKSFLLELPSFSIGGFTLTDFTIAVLDLSSVNDAYASIDLEPVAGVIGSDILLKYGAVINYASRTLSFTLQDSKGF